VDAVTVQFVEPEPTVAPAGLDPVVVQVQVSGPAGALRCRCRVLGPDGAVLVTVDRAPPGAEDVPVVEAVSALVREYARLASGAGE
jgi:hypothetical protein